MPQGDAAIDELLREITEGDLMDRRNLLLTGTATTAPALAMLLGPTSALAQSGQRGGSPSARLLRFSGWVRLGEGQAGGGEASVNEVGPELGSV
ncbi:hypothetical protein ACFVZR_38880 [Streptomyces sp. NPDC058316]|uniref:hypothetical protein n=1 Tax=unclassified Streptomyces TaxID=2593676 RepID=UPI0036E9245F